MSETSELEQQLLLAQARLVQAQVDALYFELSQHGAQLMRHPDGHWDMESPPPRSLKPGARVNRMTELSRLRRRSSSEQNGAQPEST